ncbi:hypothetical protein MYAM1_002852 [Malassezia yamatoensis]|uniref:Gluconokinase n=1 Tax=Malassezia yamatoensis TaxID=253288 RepID=A0AAJ6CIC6_9BASI|nr:hypothetical protein MYAM1_002852 [Malassezia yamatoensis]
MVATCVVVMGVSGAGKSTVAAELATELGAPYIDADDLHTEAAIEKMASGIPLTDQDRHPWLAKVAQVASTRARESDREECIVACSALRKIYRDTLRESLDARFVFLYLRLTPQVLADRLSRRESHFMHKNMLQSQLATLEEPTKDEKDVLVIDIPGEMAREQVIQTSKAQLITLLR